MTPYERLPLRVRRGDPGQDDKLVFLVRQIGPTKHSGVEVETASATVWWLEDGAIRQAAFYLDQRAALKAAGLDPDRPSGD